MDISRHTRIYSISVCPAVALLLHKTFNMWSASGVNNHSHGSERGERVVYSLTGLTQKDANEV